MALNKYKLGNLIELCTGGNEYNKLGKKDVKGVSVNKVFIETKADLENVSLNKYTIVNPKCFTFVTVTSRNGGKISIAYNNTNKSFLVSSFYVTFKLNELGKKVLLEEFLFMFLNRPEFDRYARNSSWGSAREYFYYEDMCNVEIELPSIVIQQKYVDIYNAMVENQKIYESKLDDLKLVCDGYIEKNKQNHLKKIKDFVTITNKKNLDLIYTKDNLRGINENCDFCKTRDNINDVSNYLIVNKGNFVVNFMCLGNFGKFYLAYNDTPSNIIVSPACQSFSINDNINPYYLMALLRREEFQRRCVFYGAGNTRGGINFADFAEIEVSIPNKEIQDCIAEIYNIYEQRRKINEKLKNQIKDICPILIQGALKEGRMIEKVKEEEKE